MSEWIEWNGGECPVRAGDEVEIRFDDGEVILTYQPTMWDWGHAPGNDCIIAYRVISQAPADDNASLTARIKRLEEALRPFAELAEARDKAAVVYLRGTDEAASKNSSDTELAALFAPDTDVVITDGALVSPREVTWGAFRRARAALEDK